jgi:hypothetical protein
MSTDSGLGRGTRDAVEVEAEAAVAKAPHVPELGAADLHPI